MTLDQALSTRYNVCMNAPVKPPKSLKVVKIGNSLGVILTREALTLLRVELGDRVDFVDCPDGLLVKRHDDGFAAQMDAARAVMKRRRNALRELAK